LTYHRPATLKKDKQILQGHVPDGCHRDALFLTFAQKVMPKPAQPDPWRAQSLLYEWAGNDAWMLR